MRFLTVILRGLLRRPVRTGLTLAGIAVGIAAVVALVGSSRGFEQSWERSLDARGTDIVMSNLGSALTPKPFNEEVRNRIADLDAISETSMILVEVMSLEGSPMMMVSAREWGAFSWSNLRVVEGRLPSDAEEPAVVLGTTAAETMEKEVGDSLEIDGTQLTIVGIVDGGGSMENGSAVLALELFQSITGNEGRINVIDIRLEPGTSEERARALCDEISDRVPEARAMVARDHIQSSQGNRVIRAMSWGTSLLAVLVGVFGVMNTMLMTVFERTQEICVLLALGWRRSRIVRMILFESALLGFLGGLAGVLLGVLGLKILERLPAVRGLLETNISPDLLLLAIGLSTLVGIVSGLYPAWRSSRFNPARALQG
ncbi:MAG: ABC transporter permease [Terrimicrobiaceae bacterium]|nr:ABC transporter permease [Terrimicrobiaceae bacterium]